MKFLLRSFCYVVAILTSSLTQVYGEVSKEKAVFSEPVYPVVVLGGGIGGMTASLYLARAGLQPLVIEGKRPGGLLVQSHVVQNWPAELEIDGANLTDKVRKQAEANGATFRSEEVIQVDFSEKPYTITTRLLSDKDQWRKVRAEAVIIAMGTEPNFLGVPGETGPDGYWGRGVTNCAICDGSLYRNQIVGVVGGGDAAVLEALYLSNIAKEVHVFVRKNFLKAIEERRVETLLSKPNVKIHYNTSVQKIKGDGKKLTHVSLYQNNLMDQEFPLDGLFLAIGSKPNTLLFNKILELDENGYIRLQNDQQTSIEGVYAIGDIVDPIYKQAITAAGDGAKAALQAQQYLSDSMEKSSLSKQDAIQTIEKSTFLNEVIEIHSLEQFEKELKVGKSPIVVDFYASWCGPCKRLSPIIESSANQLSGKIKFLKVNVDTLNDLSDTYQIQAMPTVLFFDASGKVAERRTGTDQICDFLKSLQTK